MSKLALLSLMAIVFGFAVQARGEEYTITLEANSEKIAEVALSIDGEQAVAKVDGITELFDLKNMRWQDEDTKRWVTLAQCEKWAKESKEESLSSTAQVPENVRAFGEWTLDPKFEIAATDDTLTLTSGKVDYQIAVEKTDRDLTNFFRYARLNAYKKAMTQRKLPPFAELLVNEELERRKLMPRSMEIAIPAVPGAPSLRMVVTDDEKSGK